MNKHLLFLFQTAQLMTPYSPISFNIST